MNDHDEFLEPDGELLAKRRPPPPRGFSDDLRRHLLELEARSRRPPHLWLFVGAYAATGVLLLIIAVAVGT
jgi:hypothetical protein